MLELSEDLKRRIATIYHEKYMLTPEQIKEQEELKQIRHKEQREREEAVRMYLTDNCLMLSRYEEQVSPEKHFIFRRTRNFYMLYNTT